MEYIFSIFQYKEITTTGLSALADLLYARSLTHFHMEYHLEADETAATSRIYVEMSNVKFVEKSLSNVFHIDMGDPDNLKANESFRFHVSRNSRKMIIVTVNNYFFFFSGRYWTGTCSFGVKKLLNITHRTWLCITITTKRRQTPAS